MNPVQRIMSAIVTGFNAARWGMKRAIATMSYAEFDQMMDNMLDGRPTLAGSVVTRDTAMNFAAFFCGVLQICQTVASLPLVLYVRTGETSKRKYKENPLYNIFMRKANRYIPSYYWKETSTNHQILFGNSYSLIIRDRGMRPQELIILNPERVDPIFDNGELVYRFRPTNSEAVFIEPENMLHIPGFGFDGIRGYSILTLARESIGLGLSFEEFTSRFVGKGAHLSGILKSDKQLSPNSRKTLSDGFKKAYAGLGNTGEIPVLEDGIKFESVSMPLADAQFLESKVFQIDEIARWLNMPPHKLKEQTRSTYSNVESENMSYYQDTIRPYLVRDEAFINFKFFADDEAFVEYLFDAILRADVKSRNEAYNIMRNAGIINGDEWRNKENMDPIPDGSGKTYWRPANMMSGSEPDPNAAAGGGNNVTEN